MPPLRTVDREDQSGIVGWTESWYDRVATMVSWMAGNAAIPGRRLCRTGMAWNAAPGAFTPRGLTELIMDSGSIRFDLFFDAAESWRAGFCPWTFFAYPTSLAVERGLPPDTEACELLAILQRRGIDVSVWVNGLADETTFFACREEDRLRLQQVIQELEESGVLEKDFCGNRSERLFALAEQRTHQRDVATPVSQPAA